MSEIQKTSDWTYYYLKSFDFTLDDIDNACRSKTELEVSSPDYDLGALDRLPLEVICMILLRLDLQSLTEFRCTNKRARLVTLSIPQYRSILTHAPALLRGSLNINTAQYFSCLELYEKLCTAECDICGDFGGYMYLITCRRVCYLCFTTHTDYLPVTRGDAVRKFGLNTEHFAKLPCMKSYPGRYSPRELKSRRQEMVFDYSSARQAGIAAHGTIEKMEEYASEMMNKRLEAYHARMSLRVANGTNPRPPRSEDLWDGKESNTRRFVGIVRAPFFNTQQASPFWGLHCIACKSHSCRPKHWRRVYTMESFQDHMRECGEIREGKHSQSHRVQR